MGLIGGMARTAVVAGTATAVSNRVSRRQANRWAAQEQPQQQQQYEEPPPQAYAPPHRRHPRPRTDGRTCWISCRSWVSCGGRGAHRGGVRCAEGQDPRSVEALMLLVPRQLRRTGMAACRTTAVGSRRLRRMRPHTLDPDGRRSRLRGAGAPPASSGSTLSHGEQLNALTHLLDSGVLTPDEYQELRARVTD